jgi:hypothetical protein
MLLADHRDGASQGMCNVLLLLLVTWTGDSKVNAA